MIFLTAEMFPAKRPGNLNRDGLIDRGMGTLSMVEQFEAGAGHELGFESVGGAQGDDVPVRVLLTQFPADRQHRRDMAGGASTGQEDTRHLISFSCGRARRTMIACDLCGR